MAIKISSGEGNMYYYQIEKGPYGTEKIVSDVSAYPNLYFLDEGEGWLWDITELDAQGSPPQPVTEHEIFRSIVHASCGVGEYLCHNGTDADYIFYKFWKGADIWVER